MKLSTKIGLGFGILIAIAAIIGSMAVWKIQDVKNDTTTLTKEYIPEVVAANNIERLSLATMYAMRGYALTGDKHYLNTGKENIAKVFEHLKIAEDLAEKSSHLSKLKTALKKVEAKIKEYEYLTDESIAKNEDMDKQRDALDKLEALYRKNCSEFFNFQNESIKKQINSEFISADESAAIKERFQKIDLINNIVELNRLTHETTLRFRASQDAEWIRKGLKNFEILEVQFKEVKLLIHQEKNIRNMDEIITIANNYKNAMKGLLENWTALQNILTKRESIADEAVKEATFLADMGMTETAKVAERTQKSLSTVSYVMIAGLVSGSVFGIFLAIILAKSISRPINRIVRELSLIADQAASGSGQVSTACQALAQGVSELAASVEETSASLEEISSLSVQNAENANKSDTLIKTVKQVVDTANISMNELSDSMKVISKAGEASFKIIKTIDNISFQTNLLALNATIEAARAGESGAGFVVVAAEVRHLASGASVAAKETSTLIQEIVKNVRKGSELVKQTGAAFSELGISIENINDFIADISQSSIEQSQGITQINKAVSDIETVIQGNAANTEESASAAQQMNAQSEMMKGFVGEIVALIEGSDSILQKRKGELR